MQGSGGPMGNKVDCVVYAAIVYRRVLNYSAVRKSKPDKQKLGRNQKLAETGHREAKDRPDRERRAQI